MTKRNVRCRKLPLSSDISVTDIINALYDSLDEDEMVEFVKALDAEVSSQTFVARLCKYFNKRQREDPFCLGGVHYRFKT